MDIQGEACLFGRVVEFLGYVRGPIADGAVADHCGEGRGGERCKERGGCVGGLEECAVEAESAR